LKKECNIFIYIQGCVHISETTIIQLKGL